MAVQSSIQNFFSTTLSGNVGASDLTIPVASIGSLTSPAYIVIDPANASKREVIYADGTFGASSFVCSALGKRGLAGSASGAQAHDSGTTVVSVPIGQIIDDLWTEVEANAAAIITDHGALTGLTDDDHTQYAKLAGATFSGTVAMADNAITRPLLTDYSEESTSPSSSSGTLTLDLTTGNDFATTLTENVTTLTISNWPASGTLGTVTLHITQHASAAKTFAWPAAVKWAGGTEPTVSAALSAEDEYVLWSRDGGTTVYGATVAQALA